MTTKTQAPQQSWVEIPNICFIRRPGDTLRCTLHRHDRGDHWHTYTRTAWPRRTGEQQSD